MKLLHIDSSILADGSVSRGLTADLVAQLQVQHPDAAVTYRDLGASPIGHLSGAHLAAGAGVVPESVAVQDDVSAGQAALAEFLAADVIVVGAPMYNFGIPSQLKAWIDRLAVAGQTFRYTEKGVEGLAGGKTVYVVSSRGGFYAGTPMAAMDHQEAYLSAVFGFFGITDVRFIRAEGIAMGPEPRATAVAKAQHEIAALAA